MARRDEQKKEPPTSERRPIISWTLALAIVGIVAAVRHLDQPWRGIIDAGVVVDLGIGVVSILYVVALAIAGRAVDVDPRSTDELVSARAAGGRAGLVRTRGMRPGRRTSARQHAASAASARPRRRARRRCASRARSPRAHGYALR
jgi:hypothetical protein